MVTTAARGHLRCSRGARLRPQNAAPLIAATGCRRPDENGGLLKLNHEMLIRLGEEECNVVIGAWECQHEWA